MSRMDKTGRQLVDESAKRQHFEQELHNSQIELAEHRNTALHAERELAKAAARSRRETRKLHFCDLERTRRSSNTCMSSRKPRR